MTPEEKAVIDQAIYLRYQAIYLRYCIDAGTAGDPPRIGRLLDVVDALIHSCPQCNAGGHTCPGDGNPIGHTATDCGRHGRDEAESAILAGEPDGSTYPCWECLTDPTEDPTSWCDHRPEDFGTQDPGHPCRLRAHAPSKCLNRPAEPSKVENLPDMTGPSMWVETTMENCLINDRIRLGTEGATVLRSNRGIWNVNTKDYWRPRADRHVELRLELDGPTAPAGFNPYPPDLAVEILCTPERLAVLRIQEGFPGSAPTSSHIN